MVKGYQNYFDKNAPSSDSGEEDKSEEKPAVERIKKELTPEEKEKKRLAKKLYNRNYKEKFKRGELKKKVSDKIKRDRVDGLKKLCSKKMLDSFK